MRKASSGKGRAGRKPARKARTASARKGARKTPGRPALMLVGATRKRKAAPKSRRRAGIVAAGRANRGRGRASAANGSMRRAA